MKTFFKNRVSAGILSSVIILIVLFTLFFIATTLKAKSFRIRDQVSEIYMGDSHVRYAVDDRLLTHSQNVANSSESTYFSYYKLKLILANNPGIKKLTLGFSYHTISGYYDDYTFGKYSNSIAANYFYILPVGEQLKMMRRRIKKTPSLLVHVLKSGAKSWLNKNTFEGGYNNPYRDVTPVEASMKERLKLQYDLNGTLQSFSSVNITYLNKIAALCKDKGVTLVLLNTPMHPSYLARVPRKFVEKYDEIVHSKNFEVLDLTRLQMPDSCYQPDGDLLSAQGAMVTTKEIIRLKAESNPHKQEAKR